MNMFRYLSMSSTMLRVADDGGSGGGGGDDAAKAAKIAADKAAADEAAEAARKAAEKDKPTDTEAKLLREVMGQKRKTEEASAKAVELEAKLKAFEGIDPEAVRGLLADKAAADALKVKAEEDRLKQAGDFESLKTRMASEHDKALKLKDDEVSNVKNVINALNKTIHELTIGSAFSASAYLKEETLLPPNKARRAYEDHFEIKDGVMNAFDKAQGAADRTPLVDARGKPLPFDEAIKSIIDADPDRDLILRSKSKPGSGTTPGSGKTGGKEPDAEMTGLNRIAMALRAKNGK